MYQEALPLEGFCSASKQRGGQIFGHFLVGIVSRFGCKGNNVEPTLKDRECVCSHDGGSPLLLKKNGP